MSKKKKIILIVSILLLVGCTAVFLFNKFHIKSRMLGKITGKIDDWEYHGQASTYNMKSFGSTLSGGLAIDSMKAGATMSDSSSTINSESTIGLSVGGAKDVNNFRENIKNGYFPISTDITYNGLFYDYSFDTGRKEQSQYLFSPSYSTAISKDPVSNNNEYFITVGLNSNIKESDFQRKKLNLVVVLDISGSMGSSLSSYYYDNNIEKSTDDSKTKMKLANESVNVLLDQLKDDDRFGMVLFDDSAYLGKPISTVGETNISAIKEHILEIEAEGGTNFEAGYTKATELFAKYKNVDSNEYENRIIVITDAMPNVGTTSQKGLMNYVAENASTGIYTSFIGVGVDFNTELIQKISDVKGANYYSVHSATDFKKRMGEEFEYMVTPLVFDLNLKLESDTYEIASVYGSDTVNKENGSIMNVNTLFPSKTESTGEVKGGVVLLKLNKKQGQNSNTLNLKVSYKDRNGKEYNNSQTVTLNKEGEYYNNTGIRKAILLERYANTLKNWIMYERTENSKYIIQPVIGIMDCNLTKDEVYRILGENERTSVALKVSNNYKEIFANLKRYIESENKYIQDKTLEQEKEILNILINK